MVKFVAKVIEGFRITIADEVREVLGGLKIGDYVNVDVELAKRASEDDDDG